MSFYGLLVVFFTPQSTLEGSERGILLYWLERTPMIATGWDDQLWAMEDLFNFEVPLLRWTPPKRHG